MSYLSPHHFTAAPLIPGPCFSRAALGGEPAALVAWRVARMCALCPNLMRVAPRTSARQKSPENHSIGTEESESFNESSFAAR